jgi:hypothetical protein
MGAKPMSWLNRMACMVLLMSAAVLAGCAPLESLLERPTPEIQPGTVLFQDDFAQVSSNWGIWDRSGGMVTYDQGGLRILVKEANYDFWSVAGKQFSDVRIESEATRLGGPEDNDFGLICRYQDNQNFYMFLVSSDGYYGIAKLKDNKHSLIGSTQLQYTGKIRPAQVKHTLRADCSGEVLRCYVDGSLLMEASDGDFQTGDVGVLAGAYSTSGVDILFDNFVVMRP